MRKRYTVGQGAKFERWTVLSPEATRSLCRCICGRERQVLNRNLVLGYSKSCGCLGGNRSVENLKGMRGDYEFISHRRTHPKIGKQPRTYWLLKCRFCARKKWSFSGNLKLGLSLRCPCQIRELALKNVESFWRCFISSYAAGAKSRKLDWKLTDTQVMDIVVRPCYYCGNLPSERRGHWKSYCVQFVNGLDRIDSKIGYVSENVVSCCKMCNRMKSNYGKEEFLAQCFKIARQRHLSRCPLG